VRGRPAAAPKSSWPKRLAYPARPTNSCSVGADGGSDRPRLGHHQSPDCPIAPSPAKPVPTTDPHHPANPHPLPPMWEPLQRRSTWPRSHRSLNRRPSRPPHPISIPAASPPAPATPRPNPKPVGASTARDCGSGVPGKDRAACRELRSLPHKAASAKAAPNSTTLTPLWERATLATAASVCLARIETVGASSARDCDLGVPHKGRGGGRERCSLPQCATRYARISRFLRNTGRISSAPKRPRQPRCPHGSGSGQGISCAAARSPLGTGTNLFRQHGLPWAPPLLRRLGRRTHGVRPARSARCVPGCRSARLGAHA